MIFGCRVERMHDAARVVAIRAGEVRRRLYLVRFYKARVAEVDPHQDWNHFADLRQRQYDQEVELSVARHRLSKAQAKLEKLK